MTERQFRDTWFVVLGMIGGILLGAIAARYENDKLLRTFDIECSYGCGIRFCAQHTSMEKKKPQDP